MAVERYPQNGSMGTWTLGVKGGRGWALEGGFLGGGVKCVRTQKGGLQCIQTLPVASRRIGGGPFTSGRNKSRWTHPELEFTL